LYTVKNTGFYGAILGFTGLRCVAKGYTGLSRVILGFTGLKCVAKGYTGLSRVILGYAGLFCYSVLRRVFRVVRDQTELCGVLVGSQTGKFVIL
jgi:hypothetical protein